MLFAFLQSPSGRTEAAEQLGPGVLCPLSWWGQGLPRSQVGSLATLSWMEKAVALDLAPQVPLLTPAQAFSKSAGSHIRAEGAHQSGGKESC